LNKSCFVFFSFNCFKIISLVVFITDVSGGSYELKEKITTRAMHWIEKAHKMIR